MHREDKCVPASSVSRDLFYILCRQKADRFMTLQYVGRACMVSRFGKSNCVGLSYFALAEAGAFFGAYARRGRSQSLLCPVREPAAPGRAMVPCLDRNSGQTL